MPRFNQNPTAPFLVMFDAFLDLRDSMELEEVPKVSSNAVNMARIYDETIRMGKAS